MWQLGDPSQDWGTSKLQGQKACTQCIMPFLLMHLFQDNMCCMMEKILKNNLTHQHHPLLTCLVIGITIDILVIVCEHVFWMTPASQSLLYRLLSIIILCGILVTATRLSNQRKVINTHITPNGDT